MMNQNKAVKIKSQDRLELEKFTKFLALKTVQVIVQSRFGMKKETKSKCVNASTFDWFNIAIEDHTEVQEHARKAFAGQIPLTDFSMCVEILLKTADGDILVLETWTLCLNEPCDFNISIASVYNEMTLLLKSAIAVTRVTPAYKLSCRQSSDSFVILYRIYFGAPQFYQLGEDYQENKIGEVVTPIGTLVMSVAHRTKMTITHEKVEKESPFMVKSDYFKPDMSPKISRHWLHGFPLDRNLFGSIQISEDVTKGVNSSPVANGHNERCSRPQSSLPPDGDKMLFFATNGESRKNSFEDRKKAGAFAPVTKIPDLSSFPDLMLPETPFPKLMQTNSNNAAEIKAQKQEPNRSADKNANMNFPASNNKRDSLGILEEFDYNCNANDVGCHKSGCSDGSDCGDFVMVDLRPPFADSDSNRALGAFFRECQSAPPLASFASQPTLEKQVTDITSQLAKFEMNMHDFDNFVDGICQVEVQK